MKNNIKILIVSTVALACTFDAPGANVNIGLVNGDFESPSIGTGATFNSTTAPTGFGWTIASGEIDLLGASYWQPASGTQSLDLSGYFLPGSIYQDFVFPSAGTWVIKFALSANPDFTWQGDGQGAGVKNLRVDFGIPGQMSSLGTFGVDADSRSIWDMNWVTITTPELLIPDVTTYRLQFTSLVPGAAGPALDRVELQIVPEPSVAGLLLVLAVGGAFHQRRLKRA